MSPRPHKFPTAAIGEEILGWKCQACGTWVREYGAREAEDCPVDWRKSGRSMTRRWFAVAGYGVLLAALVVCVVWAS